MMTDKIENFGPGTLCHVRNICGDHDPMIVTRKWTGTDGVTRIEARGVDFEFLPTAPRGLGIEFNSTHVKITDDGSYIGRPGTVFEWDEERGYFRTPWKHVRGCKITRRTKMKDVRCTVLRPGYSNYRNPHF